MTPKFSIITCVSKPDVYQSCLLDSVYSKRNGRDIEIIPIINNNNRYSASIALNIGIDASRSNILIFAHQDVTLLNDWFTYLDNAITQLDNDWGVLGCAGIALKYGRDDIGKWGGSLNGDRIAVGSVWDNDTELDKPPYWNGVPELTKVHCIDECLFIINKKTGLRFDPAFNGFHFYGIDICLQARAAAYNVFGTCLPIIHYGKYSASFTSDNKYWSYLRLLHHKWGLRFPELLSTHMHWSHKLTITPYSQTYTPEITSYIPIGLRTNDGLTIDVKSMGINKLKLKNQNV